MIGQFTATLIDGVIVPDVPLPLQDKSRLEIAINATSAPEVSTAVEDELIAYIRANPIRGGSLRLSRDELHERR